VGWDEARRASDRPKGAGSAIQAFKYVETILGVVPAEAQSRLLIDVHRRSRLPRII